MEANRKWLDSCFTTRSEEETRALGEELGRCEKLPPAIVLRGSLGAGKTRFVQGLAAGMGAVETTVSPTFSLVQEIATSRIPLFHFDFYRLTTEQEVWDLGFEDFLAGGLVVVEWGEKFPSVFPAGTWMFDFTLRGEERIIRCQKFANSPVAEVLGS